MKYLHEDMDIRSFFDAITSSSIASSSSHMEKGFNCSDLILILLSLPPRCVES